MAIVKPPVGTILNRSHPLAKGLVGCWLMNERGGIRVNDLSGNGNHGTLTNMDPATDWIMSPDGPGLDFDGVNDTVLCGSTTSLDLRSSGTVAVRFLTTSSGYQTVVSKANFNTDRNGFIFATQSWKFKIELCSASAQQTLTSSASISSGVRYSGAATWNGSTIRLYLDGKYDNSADQTVIPVDNVYIMRLGDDPVYTSGRLTGQIFYVSIWNRCLSPSEVLSFYQSPYAMFQRDDAWLYKPAAGGGPAFKPAWAQNRNRLIGVA